MTTEYRRMPVEEDWFNKKLNDIVYGYLQCLGSQHYEGKKIIVELPKTEFNKNLTQLKKILGVKDKRTITAAINKLKEAGYIAEDDEKFTFPYDENNFYITIEKQFLKYLCDTANSNVIKIYVYLKFKSNNIQNYHFTLKELKLMMGYAESTKTCDEMIRNCLACLEKQKIIKTENTYVDVDSSKGEYKAPNYILLEIADKLPESIEEKKKNFVF